MSSLNRICFVIEQNLLKFRLYDHYRIRTTIPNELIHFVIDRNLFESRGYDDYRLSVILLQLLCFFFNRQQFESSGSYRNHGALLLCHFRIVVRQSNQVRSHVNQKKKITYTLYFFLR